MSEMSQAEFTGWARVEILGHQSHVGYVRTEAYGQAVLFRIDTPELPEREYVLTEPSLHRRSAGLEIMAACWREGQAPCYPRSLRPCWRWINLPHRALYRGRGDARD